MKYGPILALALLTGSLAQAGNWPHWRGPNFNGSTDEKGLPSDWSRTENIAWTVDLPGAAAATPIVWDDKVFISSADPKKDLLQAMCYDRTNGKLLWQKDVASGIRKDFRSTFAAPSPVTDGKLVVFFYGSGDLVCFDMEGGRRWARNIQKDYGAFAFLWTFSSSPTLFDGRLYLPVLQRDVPPGRRGFGWGRGPGRGGGPAEGRGREDAQIESFLLAMEPQTGKTIWRQVRPSEARGESREAFTTPIPFEHRGTAQLLLAGGDVLTAHDPATGKELWRWGTWNPTRITHWRLVPSPVAGGGVVLACAPKRDPIYAVKAGGTGLLDDQALAWVSEDLREVSSDVPTPAHYDGDFFVLSDVQRCISRVEPSTGKVKWTVPTPGRAKYEASPLAADGKIYLINFDGQVAVMQATDGKLLRTIPMDEPSDSEVVRSSISAAHGKLFIRTTRRLYCVGK